MRSWRKLACRSRRASFSASTPSLRKTIWYFSFRATVVGETAWQANDEIAELAYFGRNELPEPASVAARVRMRDAFEEQGTVFRVVDTKAQFHRDAPLVD